MSAKMAVNGRQLIKSVFVLNIPVNMSIKFRFSMDTKIWIRKEKRFKIITEYRTKLL